VAERAAIPEPAPGFRWVHDPCGQRLSCDALTGFVHGWTTCQLRLRGTPEVEAAEWGAVAAAAGVSLRHLQRLRQVHGADVFLASHESCSSAAPSADIIASGDPAIAVVVQVADCVPLLIADTQSGLVVAAHAGWRGTAANVAGVAVNAAIQATGGTAGSLVAAVGPCIGPCCYAVGPDLLAAFDEAGWRSRRDSWFVFRQAQHLDLWRANRDQLRAAGVPDDRIFISELCTACHPDWFWSFRRDGAGTGRLAGYIRARGSGGTGTS
jgi:polyphenol oxidase